MQVCNFRSFSLTLVGTFGEGTLWKSLLDEPVHLLAMVCVCACVYVCVREERQRQREREKEADTERETVRYMLEKDTIDTCL